MIKKYRVHDLVKYDYSQIKQYTGEGYTDTPLRNDEIVDLLNKLSDENEQLKYINGIHRSALLDSEYDTKKLEKENEQLKKENEELKHEINYLENRLDDCVCLEKENRDLKEENLELSQKILKGMFEMIEKTNDIEICAEISTKRMYLILLKAQEMILENNPQYKKREIVSLLSSIEQDILMLNDKNNSINRDLFD